MEQQNKDELLDIDSRIDISKVATRIITAGKIKLPKRKKKEEPKGEDKK